MESLRSLEDIVVNYDRNFEVQVCFRPFVAFYEKGIMLEGKFTTQDIVNILALYYQFKYKVQKDES